MKETKYWVWLTMVFGVGNQRLWQVMSLYERASDAYNSMKNGYTKLRFSSSEAKNISSVSLMKADEFVQDSVKRGIELLCYSDDEYPQTLRHIFNPPAVLYCVGDITCLRNRRTVTAVGARKASFYSVEATSRICRELAEKGMLIVSGFAMGTDISAHLAAAKSGKPTVCVLGCGVDVDYPKGHLGYRNIILANGGLFISEYPPGTPAYGHNFPKRNRILAALGRVTLIFEASRKSGSLITAGMSADLGREVFVLPPADIFSDSFAGNSYLIKEGALPLLGSEDILECFRAGGCIDLEIHSEVYTGINSYISEDEEENSSTENLRTEKYRITDSGNEDESEESSDESLMENDADETESASVHKSEGNKEYYGELTDMQREIVGLLERERLHADVLSEKLGIDASELMTELTELELAGAIKALPGKMYEIIR